MTNDIKEGNITFFNEYKEKIQKYSDIEFVPDEICTFQIDKLKDLLGFIEFLTNTIDNPQFVYRGQLSTYNLIPRIFRKPYCDIKKRNSLYWDFIQQSEAYVMGIKDFPSFVKLIIMDSYGIPTPLLSWSQNCLTALYFGLEDYFNKRFSKVQSCDSLPSIWLLVNSYLEDLEKTGSTLLKMVEKVSDHYLNNTSETLPSKSLAIVNSVVSYQKYVSERIISQNCSYTLSVNQEPLEEVLKKNKVKGLPSLYKIIIENPVQIKNSLISTFKTVTLFNGIEGLAKDLLDFHLFKYAFNVQEGNSFSYEI